jgi:hypothetical protein
MGATVFRIRMELIFKRCWNLVTLRSGAELRSFVLRDTANSAAYIACGNPAAVAGKHVHEADAHGRQMRRCISLVERRHGRERWRSDARDAGSLSHREVTPSAAPRCTLSLSGGSRNASFKHCCAAENCLLWDHSRRAYLAAIARQERTL